MEVLSRKIFHVALLLSLFASAECYGSTFIILEPARDSFALGEPVVVKLTIDNQGPSSSIIYPVFLPSVAEGPETVVSFKVFDPLGHQLRPGEGISLPSVPQEPSACHFLELPASWYFGARFELNGGMLGYSFSRAGTYRVKAVLLFRAKAWVEKRMKEGKPGDPMLRSLMASRSLILDGSMQSPEVLITVREER